MAATAAQENINILRERASADDLLERANHSHLEYYQATALALRSLFQPQEHQRATPQTPTSANNMLRSDNDDSNLHGILARLRADIIHPPYTDGNDDTVVPGLWTINQHLSQGRRLSDKLNVSQKAIWNLANAYFEKFRRFKDGKGPKPKPFHLLVHGGPVTGKSFLAECIQEAATALQFTVACVALTGIVARNIHNGRTMHNFASIPIFQEKRSFLQKLNAMKFANIQERAQHETMVCKMIDGISLVGPELFAQDKCRMQQMMGDNHPFGYVAMIIMVDFNQLPPVAPAKSLYAALLKYISAQAPTNPHTAASTGLSTRDAQLFSQFRKIELT